MNTRSQSGQLIRFALETLGESNAHHEFEQLCMDVARRRLVSNLVPATGPVSSGGDQGRDGESYWTDLAGAPSPVSAFARLASGEKVVLACTIQKVRVPAKIREDVASICGQGSPVQRVLYFTVAPVPVGTRHRLVHEARDAHRVDLEIFDAVALTQFLAEPDLYFLAERYLGLPPLPGMSAASVSDLSVAVPEDSVEHRIRGREALLTALEEQVDYTGGRLVLCGVGGSGKSTVALALARRVAVQRRVWWVNAATPAAFVEALREVAVQAGVERVAAREVWRNHEAARDVLWGALNSAAAGRWLLVVDNADDPAVVRDWIRQPVAGNTVVVTSRDQGSGSWWTAATVHPIVPIPEAQGAAILRELAPDAGSEGEAASLARRLGGLPLALVLVGKYLAMTSGDPILPESEAPRTFAAYRMALDTEFAEAVAALPHDPHGPLARTWEMSLDLLEMRGTAAARPLFQLISFFAPEPLPVALLRRSVLAAANDFTGLSSSELDAAVRGLTGCGLLNRRCFEGNGSTVETLIVHPLVREITHTQPATTALAPEYSTLTAALLAKVAKGIDPANPSSWPLWRLLLPHCIHLAAHTTHAVTPEHWMRGELAARAAVYAQQSGQWSVAEEQFGYALTAYARTDSADAPESVLTARHNFAMLKRDQGRLDEAEADFTDVLRTATQALGPDHPNTLATRHELVRFRLQRGDAEGAHTEFSALVPHLTAVLGPEHPITLAARHELSRSLRGRGDLAEARRAFEQLLHDMTNALSDSAPATLTARHELAHLLLELGEVEQALDEFATTLRLERRTLGHEHPSTLVTRQNLSRALLSLGRFDEAEAELRDIYATWTRIAPRGHTSSHQTRGTLAGLLAATGRPVEAEEHFRAVTEALATTLGPTHPETIVAHLGHAQTLRLLDRPAEAQASLQSLAAAVLASHGTGHPSLLVVRRRLADVHFELEQDTAAEHQLRLLAAAQSDILGAGHPDTLTTLSQAAAVALRQGRADLASRELAAVVTPLASHLGSDDEDILSARLNLAYAHLLLGEPAAAEQQLIEVMVVYENGCRPPDELLASAIDLQRQLG
ncbi:FxSxx-COOH system tetratricopeptide repeat protein [Streptomyces antarcticus]|uniref:FxSxx-COOH system tetratricopeptide repeat protein n=1 Tax=Streptomyces antarcticus TaxID=2996458 RepID=UPI0022705500|nr:MULTISPECIES: FxSxx-COOH system tetratricopeptide repeat protein [unclassified Streptomyces]MCY0942015.1 FxSxx-COOH system tetratricopeptide repeat protein [Streptomyces sp. H34-AA3]MCZ4081967.1 FxSxx-COOH system tetratricopeptide repeat protein [Streptomyces sp. H34-S5]